MNPSPTLPIEPVPVTDNLIYFYWGRDLNHEIGDMRAGGGNHVLFAAGEAMVIDTMGTPEQALWIRDYMVREHGIERFSVINTHFHNDHTGGNAAFEDCPIVGHRLTREKMLERAVSDDSRIYVPPTVTFEDRIDLYLRDRRVELHTFEIHVPGHIVVYLPDEKLMVAGDLVEDPLPVLRFEDIGPDVQLAEFERVLAMPIDRIVATHCHLDSIRAGGYDKKFIVHMRQYIQRMLADAGQQSDRLPGTGEDYIAEALSRGELSWWPVYKNVHARNYDAIRAHLDQRA